MCALIDEFNHHISGTHALQGVHHHMFYVANLYHRISTEDSLGRKDVYFVSVPILVRRISDG